MNTFTTAARKKNRHAHSHTPPTRRAGLPAPRLEASIGAKSSDERTGSFSRALVSSLFAIPVTAVLGLIFLTVGTWVAYSNPDPASLSTPMALGALALTSLLGGFVASRRNGGESAMLCGLCGGCLFTVVLFILSLLFGDEARATMSLGLSSPAAWGIHAGVVGLEILGALIGKPRRRSPSRHTARRR